MCPTAVTLLDTGGKPTTEILLNETSRLLQPFTVAQGLDGLSATATSEHVMSPNLTKEGLVG